MRKFALVLSTLLSLIGCAPKTPPSPPILPNASDISITDVPADKPEFKRVYKTQLNQDILLIITIKSTEYTFENYVDVDGELDQKNGKWVLFDPANPADKILDRDLLPLVQAKCDQILAIDQQFRSNHPNSFIDETGVTWVRL